MSVGNDNEQALARHARRIGELGRELVDLIPPGASVLFQYPVGPRLMLPDGTDRREYEQIIISRPNTLAMAGPLPKRG